MRRFLAGLVGCLALSGVFTGAQRRQSVPAGQSESSGAWFVEFASPPAIDGTTVATLDHEAASFHAAAADAGVRYTKGRSFQKLWNGVTVRATAAEVPKLRALAGVQAVYPVVKIARQQLESQPGVSTDLITALAMTGADVAHSALGLSGRGVTVAVIDSGIDYHHPDLGGCFGRHCRVAAGFDLVGDDFDSGSPDPARRVPHPDSDPVDNCDGHGTHVSGIIGASGGITGVAPGVTFQAYRVFGCEGTTTADLLLAAMEMALDGKADVVNLSVGSAFQWPQYPSAVGADNLVKHGIVVVSSIGNEGALGLYSASAPGVAKNVIGVASFDNSHANLSAFTISPDGAKVGYIAATGAPAPPVTGSRPMARTGTPASTADGCAPLPPGSLSGKVALIRRGGCVFSAKAANAQAAGAAGVVLYNNVDGFLTPTVVGPIPITVPVVAVSAAKGMLIDGRIAGGSVTMTWTSLVASEPQATAGLVSDFSSWGLPADLSFKPDIGAPGGTIRSTLPLALGGYGNLSGTSMASPHVAGAVALLLEAHPHAKPEEIEQRLQNTARPHLWWGDPSLGFLDNVHRQGAGMVHVDDAAQAAALIAPSSLALGEIQAGAVTRTLRISLTEPHEHRPPKGKHDKHHPGHDDEDDPVTYTLGHEPALATGANTFDPEYLDSFATVRFSTPSVTLGGHHRHDADEASVAVRITPPADDSARLFGGYLTFTPSDGGTILRVPYAGYHGDYQAIVALEPTPLGFPWLAKIVDGDLVNEPDGAAFTLVGDDQPNILLHLDHQVRTLALEVIDRTTGRSAGFADLEDYLGRNSGATSFFAFAWDGTTIKRAGGKARPVQNGTYRLELSVLKALGDPRRAADTERWTSPDVVISRP